MSDDEIKNLMGRAKDYLGKLDDTAKGESAEWLYAWSMGYHDDWRVRHVESYYRLGCTWIPVGQNVASGMGNEQRNWLIRNEVAPYCLAHLAAKGFPVGLHRIGSRLNFKFPERVPPLGWHDIGRSDFYLGSAAMLENDWYLYGHKVRRLRPDDPLELLLRAPIRNKFDATSVALAIRDARPLPRSADTKSEAMDFRTLAEELADISECLERAGGYPVNLAEMYRRLESTKAETGLNEPLRTNIVEEILGFARNASRWLGSRGDEAQHIWKLIQSTIIGRPKIAGD